MTEDIKIRDAKDSLGHFLVFSSLCFLPLLCRRFLAAIRLKRAEEALATRALLVGRLRTLLEEAR